MSFICRAPWTSMAFQPTGVGPCCIYEINNEDHGNFDKIKQKFLSGQIPTGCNKCQQAHDAGIAGYYKHFEKYQTNFEENQLQEINIKSNNFCNLACRSCGPHFSSKWEQEFNRNIVITKDHGILEKLKHIDFSKLKMIVFAGGEPTLTDEHLYVLQHLVSTQNTSLNIQISTNIHVLEYKNHNLIDLWRHFANLNLQLSIDAIGPRAEVIRSGTDWNLVEKNLKTIVQSGINHYVNITVSALNIWFLDETLEYLKDNLKIKHIKYNFLYDPDILNIRVIPIEYRNTVNQILDRAVNIDKNANIIKNYFEVTCTDELWQHFLIYNLLLDVSRKEKFIDQLPIKNLLIDKWLKL